MPYTIRCHNKVNMASVTNKIKILDTVYIFSMFQTQEVRGYWCDIAIKLGSPILEALAARRFKAVFQEVDESRTACLEALARVLVGLAPWFELGIDADAKRMASLARDSIDSITDPNSPDYMSFSEPEQALVESALIAQALLRSKTELWDKLSDRVKNNLVNSLKSSRAIAPHDNNWVLFPSMVEAFLTKSAGCDVDTERLAYGINMFRKWYVGDGLYGDGDEFHFDYYNSIMIHPMLIEILDVIRDDQFMKKEVKRLRRWAVIQERLISPNGTFPPVGRSLAYRCGAFHSLALCVYRKKLPQMLFPGQVRNALTQVIRATLDVPNTFEKGWLTIGLCGNQPSLAEPYMNRGSVYMCCTVLLPLGLPVDDEFWHEESAPATTWERIWSGKDAKRDRPYTECRRRVGRCP